jgi:hypothetical protein
MRSVSLPSPLKAMGGMNPLNSPDPINAINPMNPTNPTNAISPNPPDSRGKHKEETMKQRGMRIIFMTILIGFISAGVASADNSLKKDAKALSFGIANSDILISGRMFLQNDLAVLAGVGFDHSSNNDDTTDYGLEAGIRKYIQTNDLAPFVGGIVSYRRQDFIVPSGGGGTDVNSEKTFAVSGVGGVEYFLTKQASVEAQVGIGLSSIHNVDGSDDDQTKIGTFSSAVTVNFYLP